MTANRLAFHVALWQLLGAFALFAVEALLDLVVSVDLPRSLSTLAVLVGAQAYASSAELRQPGAVAAQINAVAWRASLLTFLVQAALAAVVVAVALRADPEVGEILDWMVHHAWSIPVVVLVGFGVIYAVTRLGLGIGVKAARKGLERQAKAKAKT